MGVDFVIFSTIPRFVDFILLFLSSFFSTTFIWRKQKTKTNNMVVIYCWYAKVTCLEYNGNVVL
jgi:hypothetical protein